MEQKEKPDVPVIDCFAQSHIAFEKMEKEDNGDDSNTTHKIGDQVLAYHGPMLYPAKVRAIRCFNLPPLDDHRTLLRRKVNAKDPAKPLYFALRALESKVRACSLRIARNSSVRN